MLTGDAREMAKTGERQAILDELATADGKPLKTAQIASALGKKAPNISHLLKRLADAGQVQREGYGKWKLPDPHSNHSNHSNRSSWGESDDPFGDED